MLLQLVDGAKCTPLCVRERTNGGKRHCHYSQNQASWHWVTCDSDLRKGQGILCVRGRTSHSPKKSRAPSFIRAWWEPYTNTNYCHCKSLLLLAKCTSTSFSLQDFASPGLHTGVTPACSPVPAIPPSVQTPAGKKDSLAVDLWGLIPLDWSALTEALRSVISGVGSGVSRCS